MRGVDASLMALTSAGNETVDCPKRGEGVTAGENEAGHAGLLERCLERAGPAGEPNRGTRTAQRVRGRRGLQRIHLIRRA